MSGEIYVKSLVEHLELPVHVVQKLTSEQLRCLSILSQKPPQIFAEAVKNVSESRLRECLVSVGYQGSKASEIPFSELCIACAAAGIRVSALQPHELQLLLAGLCRNPATKILNLTLFLTLFKRWTKADKSHISNEIEKRSVCNADIESMAQYLQLDKSGVKGVIDLITDRLFPSDVKQHSYARWMKLATIVRLTGVHVSESQQHALIDFLQFSKLIRHSYMGESDVQDIESAIIDMELLYALSNYHRQLIDFDNDHHVVIEEASIPAPVSRLLRYIHPHSKELLQNLTMCGEQRVSFSQLKSALQEVGLRLGLNDQVLLWNYLGSSQEANSGHAPLPLQLLRDLLLTRPDQASSDSIVSAVMRDQAPPRMLKAGSFPSSSYSDNVCSLLSNNNTTQPTAAAAPTPTTAARHQELSSGLPWQVNQGHMENNLYSRVRQRIQSLSDRLKLQFISHIARIDDVLKSNDYRSIITEALLSVGIKLSAKESESIKIEFEEEFGLRKLCASHVLTWFGIDSEQFQDTSHTTIIPSESRGVVSDIGYSQTRSRAHHQLYRTSQIFREHETEELVDMKSIETNMQGWAQPSICNESIRISIDNSIQSEGDNSTQRLAIAIDKLSQQRPIIAYIFRRLSHPGCRLQEFSVSCSSLARALIDEPLKLPLTYDQAWHLVCDMSGSDPTCDHDTASILFSDVTAFLDKCKADSIGTVLLKQQIRQKLMTCKNIGGDRLRMMALTPLLRHRNRQKKHRSGFGAANKLTTCWEGSEFVDFLNVPELQSLLSTVELNLTLAECSQICHETGQPDASFGELSTTLPNAISWLCSLLQPASSSSSRT